MLKECKLCGNYFWTNDISSKYCSDAHRRRAGYLRKKKAKKLLREGMSINEVYIKLNKVSKKRHYKKMGSKKQRLVCPTCWTIKFPI